VIIVNNNSTDSTQQIAESFCEECPNFRVVREEKQGLSHARNRGWREAAGEYVAYIDDDAKASPDWCELILEGFQTVRPEPAAVGGEIFPWYEKKPPEWFSDEFEIRTWGKEKGFLQPPNASCGFSGSNMAFPKFILERFGGFSPDFGMVGEKMNMGDETQLFLRLYNSKLKFWYNPKIKVFHWTPVRNTKITYRFKRSVVCGRSSAGLDGRRIFSIQYVRTLARLGLIILKIPYRLITSKNIKTSLIKMSEEMGFVLGYLAG